MTQEELNKIVEQHQHWLHEDVDGWEEMRANLTRANLTGANLRDANLYGANLTRANLTRADLTGANLRDANLTGANLTRADLTGANLTRADLTGADLTGANLRDANLRGANLRDADLTGANLYGANLTGANQELAQCGAVILRMMEFVDNEERTKKIPEPKTRRATWQQLAYWLIDGKGLAIDTETNRVDTGVFFSNENMHEEVGERWKVMKRGDSEWNEPTVDYMGLEEK